jgi:hypothetical protein
METEIWKYERSYKVYTEERDIRKKLMAWKDCILHCRYSHMSDMKEIGWDFIFPGRIRNRVAELVGLPPQKDPGRVARGRKLGKWAIANDHLSIQTSGCIGR